MQVEGYDIDIVVQGFPGKSVCRCRSKRASLA